MQEYRRRQEIEWNMLDVRKELLGEGILALLVFHNEEITDEERARRLQTLPIGRATRAFRIAKNSQLRGVFWNYEEIPDGLSEEDWDEWVKRYQEAREALVDLPLKCVETQKKKAIEWVLEQENLLRKDFRWLQTLETCLWRHRNINCSLRKSFERAQKWLNSAEKQLTIFLTEKNRRLGELRGLTFAERGMGYKRIQQETAADENTLREWVAKCKKDFDEVNEKYSQVQKLEGRIKNLRSEMRPRPIRLQRVQSEELRDWKESHTCSWSKKLESSDGPTTQADAAGCSKPTTHSSESLKELAPEDSRSRRSFRRSSRERSRDCKRYGKICHWNASDARSIKKR
jgi:hypothetical protein